MQSKLKHAGIAGVLAIFSLFTIGVPSYFGVEQLPITDNSVEPVDGQAMMCIGFNTQKSEFGFEYGNCPADHAFYGVDDPGGKKGPAEKLLVVGGCCPLPSKDILTDEHTYAPDECPAGYVATGTMTKGAYPEQQHLMRCTKINTERYQLAQAKPSKYWGDGAAGWQGSDRILWDNIPAGMRYANGRTASGKWDVDGCVGFPWGSMLTKKESKYCSGLHFSQLQFKGLPGDPATGTPVKMFADCDEVVNYDDPRSATCIKNNVVTAARALPTNS